MIKSKLIELACDSLKKCKKRIKVFLYLRRLEILSDIYIKQLKTGNHKVEVEQKQTLSFFLNYAKEHSQYYGNLLKKEIITEDECINILKRLPLSNKQIIRRKRKEIYSDEINKTSTYWVNTGGSTGEPLHFPFLKIGKNWEHIHQMMLYKTMGWKTRETIVSIDGSTVDTIKRSQNKYYVQSDNFPYGKFSFSTLYMSDETLHYYIQSLNQIRPKIMRGYPSGILKLAFFINKKRCKLIFKLRGIYLTSESFSAKEREYIQNTFKCNVYGQYGHTETSIFAVSFSDLTYYCSPFYGFTEVINKKGEHAKVGETGEVVVTGFSNYGTPFIRYQTGDLAEYGGTQNGIIKLNHLQGREADYIINKALQKIYVVGFLFGSHIKAFNEINEWQIEQEEIGKAILRIVKDTNYQDSTSQEIRSLFINQKIDLNIIFTDQIPQSNNGKKKFIIQHIKDI